MREPRMTPQLAAKVKDSDVVHRPVRFVGYNLPKNEWIADTVCNVQRSFQITDVMKYGSDELCNDCWQQGHHTYKR